MDVIFKFVVPLMEMICSLITLALWFKWKFDQGKWSQRTLRPCQRIRFEGGKGHVAYVCRIVEESDLKRGSVASVGKLRRGCKLAFG